MASNRRRSVRVGCSLSSNILSNKTQLAARVVDLSPEGLRLVVDLDVPIGQLVKLELALADGALTCYGAVRHTKRTEEGNALGIQFFALKGDEQRRILSQYRRLTSGAGRGKPSSWPAEPSASATT